MSKPHPVTVVNVGHRSTNIWVVSAGDSRLLVDLGWPGTMGMLRAKLNRMDVSLKQLRRQVFEQEGQGIVNGLCFN